MNAAVLRINPDCGQFMRGIVIYVDTDHIGGIAVGDVVFFERHGTRVVFEGHEVFVVNIDDIQQAGR